MPARTKEREQFLADIITTAIEGGTGYWACVHRYKWEDIPPSEVHAVIMIDDEEHYDALRAHSRYFRETQGRKPSSLDLIEMGAECDGEPLLYKIDINTIAKGIGIVREEGVCADYIRKDILHGDIDNEAGDIDADGADVIVQAALFGKLVFG